MKKLLLILKENIVSYARIIDYKWVENAINTFPYRKNEDDGNPYARALRHRDHHLNRGTDMEVILLNEDAPEKYYFKKYNPVAGEFFLWGMTEKERQDKIANIEAFYGIREQYDIDYLKPGYEPFKGMMTEDIFDSLSSKIRKHEPFSDNEVSFINSNINKLSGDIKTRAIYIIAAHYSRLCIDPPVGIVPSDRSPEHRRQWRDITISWWEKLIGTEREKEALKEIARVYAWTGKETKAIEICNNLLKRNDLSSDEIESIKRRIAAIGVGREIYDEAVALYDKSDYSGCSEKLDEFEKGAKGATKQFLAYKVSVLKGKCLIGTARKSKNISEKKSLQEKAVRFLYPERN